MEEISTPESWPKSIFFRNVDEKPISRLAIIPSTVFIENSVYYCLARCPNIEWTRGLGNRWVLTTPESNAVIQIRSIMDQFTFSDLSLVSIMKRVANGMGRYVNLEDCLRGTTYTHLEYKPLYTTNLNEILPEVSDLMELGR